LASAERRAPLLATLALVRRELSALARSGATWAGVGTAAVLGGLGLRGALDDTLEGALAGVFGALLASVAIVFPLVAARAFARDRESGADVLLAQLGHRALPMLFARLVALMAGFLLFAAPALSAAAVLRLGGAEVDLAVASALLGHALYALFVCGAAAVAAGLTRGVAAARLATLVVVAGLWLHERAGGKGGAFLPSAAVGVFERGVIDGRDVLALLAGGLGLCVAGIALQGRAPLERRALRAGLALLVTAGLTLAASQVRRSWDVTSDRRSSLAPAAEASLALVGDPIRATVGVRADDPSFARLQREVLLPLARASRLRVVHDEGVAPDDVVWQVGGRTKTSRISGPGGGNAEQMVPLVLELAGVKAPAVIDLRPPARRLPGGRERALFVLWGLWPALAAVLLLSSRRR
jgi:hypothetical protein